MKGRSWQLQGSMLVFALLCTRSDAAAQPSLATVAQAQPVHLAELETRAHRSQRGKDARLQAARARIQAARAAYSPSVNLISDVTLMPGQRLVDIGPYKVSAAFPIDRSGAFQPALRYGAMLDLRGNLYDFGRTGSAVDAAEAEARAEQADARGADEQSVRDVRAGYVRWVSAYALWTIAQRAQLAAAESLTRTRAAIEEGARPAADQTAAETGEGFAQLELERAYAELESARDDLGFIAATELASTAYPADDVLNAVPVVPALEPGHIARLGGLREQQVAAQASARAHDHVYAPVLSANAQAGLQGLDDTLFPVYRVGVSVLVPLWDGGSEAAQRGLAQARGAQLGAQAEELERAAKRVQQRRQTLKNQAERRIAVAERLLGICRTRVSQLEAASPLGAASFVELSDARAAVSRAETELVLARALRAQVWLGLE
jgi:adhesin transport system outer membrane protein